MSMLRCQFIRKLVNYKNRYVCLKTSKRNYIWDSKLRERNRYEYNLSELAKCLKKLELVGSSPISPDNALNYLSKYLKQNDCRTKEDILLIINGINYAFKSNQTIGNVIQDWGEKTSLNRFLAQVELHINDMTFDELVSALIAFSSINIPLSSSVLQLLTIDVGRRMKGLFYLIC